MLRRSNSYFSGDRKSVTGNKSVGLQCRVLTLDGSELQLDINKKTSGQWIFDHMLKKLNIQQSEYFGLLFEDEQKFQQWLDLTKPVRKQLKKSSLTLLFCVRYYPVDPLMAQTPTKSQLYWQVKRDFIDGRLPCTSEMAAQLCGYIAQIELSDWLEPRQDYLIALGLLNTELYKLEDEIIKHHRQFKGTSPVEAMSNFLDIASGLEFYGMAFFEVKYEEKLSYVLGLSPHGIALCKEFTIIHSYSWCRVVQVSYRGKHFTVKVTGDWAAKNKSIGVHFDVDSIKVARELYFTFIDYINFYKDTDGTKFDSKDATKITIPSSISTEGLSQFLLQSIEEEEKRREKQQLHRSLSLPRRSHVQVQPKPHPLTTKITTNNASNQMRSSLGGTTSLSSKESLDEEGHMEEGENGPFDTESMESHDSLLDLADDLGDDDNGSAFVKSKKRSNSNPEIFSHSVGREYHRASNRVQSPDESLNEKKKNRLLLQNWVTEQKKLDEIKSFSPPLSPSAKTLEPPVILTFQSSPPRPYKLRNDIKTSLTPSPSHHSPYLGYRPNSAAGNYMVEDLYSIPRSSAAPSPSFIRRPHPFSLTGSSNLLAAPSVGSHNDYDIPRSLIDLRRVDSSHSSTHEKTSYSHQANARSESSLTGATSSTSQPLKDSLSSIPNSVNQVAYLKHEYPDYDIPKPSTKDYPDYDIPKPHSSRVSTTSEPSLPDDDVVVKTQQSSTQYFGVLDSIMSEIDDLAAVHNINAQSLPSLIDKDLEEEVKPRHVKENSTPAAIFSQVVPLSADENKKEPIYDRLSAKIALEKLKADGIIDATTMAENEKIATDEIDDKIVDKTEDQMESNEVVNDIGGHKEVMESAEEKRKEVIARPPDHLYDISKNFKLKSAENNSFLTNLPFDPNFFACQVELEKKQKGTKEELPPQVARFMSWVKTGNANTKTSTEQIPSTDEKQQPLTNVNKSPPTQRKTPPIQKQSPTQKQSPPTQRKTPPSSTEAPPPTQKPARINQEPIYHEVGEQIVPARKPTPPPIDQLLALRPHPQGSDSDHERVTMDGGGGGGKENKLLKQAQRNSTLKKESSLPQISNQKKATSARLGGKQWQSFNTRRPLQIKLDKKMQSHDDESVPNSPSFYTSNPAAATMPFAEVPLQKDLKEQLTQLEGTTGSKHHHVVNWMKGAQKFWDGEQHFKSTLPAQRPKKLPPHERPLISSQSVHSNLLVTTPTSQSGFRSRSNQLKDHLYEDPDVLLKSTRDQRIASEPFVNQTFYRPRAQTTVAARKPYVTREVHRGPDGGTVYATDV